VRDPGDGRDVEAQLLEVVADEISHLLDLLQGKNSITFLSSPMTSSVPTRAWASSSGVRGGYLY
jgi:hypothetical protein